jgi:choline-glycine betaine transporter
VSNGAYALAAIQTISIISALPFALLLCYFMQSILLMCKVAELNSDSLEYTIPEEPEFHMPIYVGIFNVMEQLTSLGRLTST